MARSERWRYRSFYLTHPALEKLNATLGIDITPYFTATIVHDLRLIRSFLNLHRALQKGANALLAQECLVATFGQLFRRYGSGGQCIPIGSSGRTSVIVLNHHSSGLKRDLDTEMPADLCGRSFR